jgi:DNA-binding CsgD family transcriptional regulator
MVELTPREREVMTWAVQGKTTSETALILDMSPNTVGFHRKQVFKKLGVYTMVQAAWKLAQMDVLDI